jgi:hypothetical protein
MQTTLLIDAIVRQAIALVAQLSTPNGARPPPAPNEAFLRLALAMEPQTADGKVSAETLGLALQGLQERIPRQTGDRLARESALWKSLLELIDHLRSVSRADIQERFGDEGDLTVAAVLDYLVGSGLVTVTGQGLGARYSLTTAESRARLLADLDRDAFLDLTWTAIYRGARTESEVAECLRIGHGQARSVIKELVAGGRVEQSEPGAELRSRCPATLTAAEQAAALDHFRVAATAIANEVRHGQASSQDSDVIGGATLSFDLEPEHPFEQRVTELLHRAREDVTALWSEVHAFNREYRFKERRRFRVWFYFGQSLERPEDRGEPRAG